MRADGRTLQASLPPDTWAKLDAYAKSHNVPLANLQSFEPWFVSLMISIMEMQRLGLDAELGLDKYFAAMAAKAGKPTAGLETGDMQIALFDGMTDAEQTQLILDTLDELDGSGKRIDEMHAMWRRGEGDRLFAETGAEMKAKYPSLYARMNSDRNRAWLPQVQKMLDDGNSDDTLVVVGSMHLLGSDGLVALLKAKGYTVEKL
jgi:uncharacterized protein